MPVKWIGLDLFQDTRKYVLNTKRPNLGATMQVTYVPI